MKEKQTEINEREHIKRVKQKSKWVEVFDSYTLINSIAHPDCTLDVRLNPIMSSKRN